MNKWECINAISNASDKSGNLLIELMDECHCINLQQVPEEKAKEFYERKVKKKVTSNE